MAEIMAEIMLTVNSYSSTFPRLLLPCEMVIATNDTNPMYGWMPRL